MAGDKIETDEQQKRVEALTLFLQSQEFRKLAGEIAKEQLEEFQYPVTTEDHDRGLKMCEAMLRSGKTEPLMVRAIPLRKAFELRRKFEEEKDIWIFLEAALNGTDRTDTTDESIVDQLLPRCADGLLRVALTLAFGEADQKKMVAWLELRRQSISENGCAWN
jgi:hypothetical protein